MGDQESTDSCPVAQQNLGDNIETWLLEAVDSREQ